MKEQRNSKSRVFLPGGGGGSGTASRDWKRVLSLIVFLRAACLTRALGNPRLPFSEVRAAGGAPETPWAGGAVRTERAPPMWRRLRTKNGAAWEEEDGAHQCPEPLRPLQHPPPLGGESKGKSQRKGTERSWGG